LIHAGDFTQKGKAGEASDFLSWFSEQPARYKIFVAGNHDFCMENDLRLSFEEQAKQLGLIYLNDSGVTIEGINIWGSPITPWFHDWAFNRHRGEEIRKHWELIPCNTNILITHGPVMNVLDKTWRGLRVGCEELAKMIFEENRFLNLKLHVCGHIHEDRGIEKHGGVCFVNASSFGFNPLLRQLNFFELEINFK
jgi:Icc-related predicted phosphoesterase